MSGAFSDTALIPVNMTAAGAFETIDLLVKGTAGPGSSLNTNVRFTHMEDETERTAQVSIGPADGNGRSDGDPHLSTFDGVGYDFQAAGEFTLVIGDGFEIQARQVPRGAYVAVNEAVAMRIGDDVVGIYADKAIPLAVNDTAVVLEAGESIAVGNGSVYFNGSTYLLTDENGNGVWARVGSSFLNLRVFVDEGDVAGLLGNNNDDRGDDFQLRDGTILSQPLAQTVFYGDFADSWRITQEDSLFVYAEGETTETFTDRNFPVNIIRPDDLDPVVRATAEAVAIANGLTPGTFEFETTVFDVALTGNNEFAEAVREASELQFEREEGEIVEVQVNWAPTAVQDTASVVEDGSVDVDVRANDTDPEGDMLTLVGGTDPNGGTVTVVNGDLRFAPAPDFSGETTLSYDLTDAGGNSVTGRVVVTVNAQPDVPVANDDGGDGFKTDQNTALTTASVLINDSDADGDTLQVKSISLAGTLGLVTNNGDGTFGYDPNGAFDRLNFGETATDTFSYTVSDGNGGTSVATVTLTITSAYVDGYLIKMFEEKNAVIDNGVLVGLKGGGFNANDAVSENATLVVNTAEADHIKFAFNTDLRSLVSDIPKGTILDHRDETDDLSYLVQALHAPDGETVSHRLSGEQINEDTFVINIVGSNGAVDTLTLTGDYIETLLV